MENIKIKIAGKTIEAELHDNRTAAEILDALPFEGIIKRWGDEIYFTIPVDSVLEEGTEAVEEGTIAFWPPGNAFCIFFGPTPASTDSRPRAAGPVTVIGKISKSSDVKYLKPASDGERIKVER